MKKLLLFILAMVMTFTLIACSGADNDENNAVMQAKIDELDTISQELVNWYKDNGYLEGDTAAKVQPIVDKVISTTKEIKASHQEVLDKGGYSDEDVTRISAPLDQTITGYKKAKEEQKTFDASAKAGEGIAVIAEKFNTLVDIVNQASKKAEENGWGNDAAFNSELDASIKLLEVVKADLEKPDSIDEAYMKEIVSSFDELIPVWKDYLAQVSKPYTKK